MRKWITQQIFLIILPRHSSARHCQSERAEHILWSGAHNTRQSAQWQNRRKGNPNPASLAHISLPHSARLTQLLSLMLTCILCLTLRHFRAVFVVDAACRHSSSLPTYFFPFFFLFNSPGDLLTTSDSFFSNFYFVVVAVVVVVFLFFVHKNPSKMWTLGSRNSRALAPVKH